MATETSPPRRRLGRHSFPSRRGPLIAVAEGIALTFFHLPVLMHACVTVVVHATLASTGTRPGGHSVPTRGSSASG